jgi:hypothetical protein
MTSTRLMTFAEFEQLPNPKSGHYERCLENASLGF